MGHVRHCDKCNQVFPEKMMYSSRVNLVPYSEINGRHREVGESWSFDGDLCITCAQSTKELNYLDHYNRVSKVDLGKADTLKSP